MNIFDANLHYSLLDVIISITLFILSFLVFFYFGYTRDIKERLKENHKFKDMLIDSYIQKFDEYNQIISDLRTKMDMIELKINPQKEVEIQDILQDIQHEFITSNDTANDKSHKKISHNIPPVMKDVIITNKDNGGEQIMQRLNTVDSVLKMLEVPLTSREIQVRIKKSREHTSRLLKKLYSEDVVMRDESTRPFRYKITDEGRRLLEQTTSSRD
jgi:Transcriptional regulator of a riboflavin/FAD biosynthetic operon